MVMRLFCCLLLLTAMPLMAATKLEASVDKNPVLVGEFFTLSITVDDTIKNQQPDTSALLQDFVVGPTSLSTRTNIINGSIQKQTTWSVKLMSRTAGEYTIPAFKVAGLSSEAITLTVAKRAVDGDKNNDIFIKTQLSSDALFVQEAGVYTVKLYLAKELLDGSLSTPSMADAQLSQLGKQSEAYELVDGKRYLVITREYLIQPQKSGDYTITGPTFQGRIQQNYRQLEVSALGDDQQITIKPIPSNYHGDWLPSELVSLDEQWQPEDNEVEVGTPITRTITLTALGVTKEQLPDISLPTIKGIRSYPDQQETNNAVRSGRVVSQQVASYALLPQTPGTYTLPEITLPWYNTKMNRISYATLPQRTLIVKPSSAIDNSVATNPPPNSANLTTPATNPPSAAREVTTQPQSHTPLWLILVAAVGYILWIVTAIFYYLSRSTAKHAKTTVSAATNNAAKPSLKALSNAAKANDTTQFYSALTAYATAVTGQQVGAIDSLCQQLNQPAFTRDVQQLQAQLYGCNGATHANLTAIVKVLSSDKTRELTSPHAVLKDLYH
jgi:hypothetical protein